MSKHRASSPAHALRIEPECCEPAPCYETLVGTLVDWPSGADPVVEFEGPGGLVVRHPAAMTVDLDPEAIGHAVVIMFLRGDLAQPVITGRLRPGQADPKKLTRTRKLVLEGRELLLNADGKLTLKCGKSSITLTRDGRIEIRGTDLSSRASSVNRIKGGTILLN